jgi:N utilization substance protein A
VRQAISGERANGVGTWEFEHPKLERVEMSIKLGTDEMRYIALFESLTGVRVHDCIIEEGGSEIIFVVRKGDVGLAVGKNGSRIRKAKQMIGKSIKVIEHSSDPVEFVKNVFMPARVSEARITEHGGKKIALISVEEGDKGIAVGRGGKTIRCAKKLALRHHGIQDISIA